MSKLKDFSVVINPRMQNLSHTETNSIGTSPLFQLYELCDRLGVDEISLDRENYQDHDFVVSRYIGSDIEEEPYASIVRDGLLVELHWCSLNSAWFLERVTHKGLTLRSPDKNAFNKDIAPEWIVTVIKAFSPVYPGFSEDEDRLSRLKEDIISSLEEVRGTSILPEEDYVSAVEFFTN